MTIVEWVLISTASITMLASLFAALLARLKERAALHDAALTNRLKNDFVSMITHELRTPVTSISGFASTLAEDWRNLPEEEVDEFLTIIRRQSDHLRDLVEDVLMIPRLETGRVPLEPEVFDLSALILDVTELVFPPGEMPEASVAIPGGIQNFADPLRVRQVLRNLLDNARKYGGDQVLVEGALVGEHYMVTVSDNGRGVAIEHRKEIFHRFEQVSKGDARSARGIGLGLPIARRLSRAMGGDVWHEPRFPTGSRFCFTIPALTPDDEHYLDEHGDLQVVRRNP